MYSDAQKTRARFKGVRCTLIYRDKAYVEQLHPRLIEICTLLNEVHMTDNDCDLVACSFRDTEWRRCVYVYLDIEGLDLETDDLEECEIKNSTSNKASKAYTKWLKSLPSELLYKINQGQDFNLSAKEALQLKMIDEMVVDLNNKSGF